MSNFLIKIRNYSDSKKKKLIIIYTIIVMLIVFLVWYFLSGIVIGPVKYIAEETKKTSEIGFIKNVFEDSFTSIVDSFFQTKDNFNIKIE